MGAADVRLDPHGDVDFRLKRQLRSYTKEDPPTQRVKPIPIQVVRSIVNASLQDPSPTAEFKAVADMICIAFFFMCRPGEHTVNKDNTPFRLCDVRLFVGATQLDPVQATETQVRASTSVSLVFTTQKNGVKGEVISHGLSGDPNCCPVQAVIRRVLYLRTTPELNSIEIPLCAFIRVASNGTRKITHVSSIQIKQALQAGIAAQGINERGEHRLQIAPEEIDARSLRAGGATALLCAQVDPNSIQLMGRWRSDAMIRYLHIAAKSTLEQYAAKMFHGGHYSFNPGLSVPVY